ncbi:hypothetical protein NAC44_11875 [Allorhizobium sp. BGMRC 0089]|uniref:hypothetical protein n=1 Tax=Allorhizobium sonneratiae TaxID=2934936 RepID=UPI002033DED5|nr:hypothetical protein [Allorhizobium sonneratiae]MCM2293020.1 hypothetical protein [Allorhizobium sonneratiae]
MPLTAAKISALVFMIRRGKPSQRRRLRRHMTADCKIEGHSMTEQAFITQQFQMMHERLENIQRDGSERGRRLWEKLGEQDRMLAMLDDRTRRMEQVVSGHQAQMDEIDKMRVAARGAGQAGRFMLVIGGSLLSFIAWVYTISDHLLEWLRWLIRK